MSVVVPASVRRASAVALVLSGALLLAGCVDQPAEQQPTGTPSTTATPTSTPTPEITPVGDELMPVDVPCTDLVDPDAVYAFDPNLALIGAFTPEAGSEAATDAAASGVVCRWVRESGGVTMDVSVGRYPEARLTALKNEAYASSTMVPTYGDEAYFSTAGGAGTAIVFSGGYRIVVTSPEFSEPGEPTGIIQSIIAALPA